MVVYPAQAAKRAFVALLLYLARHYCLKVPINRESNEKSILAAFRKVALKAHPDKGGSLSHFQQLNDARDAWEKAKKKDVKASASASEEINSNAMVLYAKGYRINSIAVLLTYQGLTSLADWEDFVVFVSSHSKKWKVRFWTANRSKAC